MTSDELLELLRKHFDGATFALPSSALPGSPAARAITEHFEGSLMKLGAATRPERDGDRVVISTGTPIGLLSLPIATSAAAEWWNDGSGVQMRVKLIPPAKPDGYALVELYPLLSESLTRGYRFTSPILTIDSSAARAEIAAVQEQVAPGLFHPAEGAVVRQLGFAGAFVWPDALAIVRAFLGGTAANTTGVVQIIEGVPRYLLRVAGAPVAVGHFTLGTELGILGLLLDRDYPPPADERPQPDGMHLLTTTLALRQRTIALRSNWSRSLPMSVDVVSSAVPDLTGLIRELGKEVLNVEIPDFKVDGLPWLQTFALSGLQIGIDIGNKKLQSVSATFSLFDAAHALTLIPDLLTLDKLQVELAIAGDGSTPSAVATGNLTIKDAAVTGPFEVSIEVPAMSFRVGLGESSTLSAGTLLRRFLPALPTGNDVIIGDLEITGSRADASFTFGATLEPEPPLDLFFFRLEEVTVGFAYSRAGGVPAASAEMTAALRTDKFSIDVSGSIANDGWQLAGSLAADPPLDLGALLPSGLAIPPEILTAKLTSIDASIGTSGGTNLSFAVKGKLQLDFGAAGALHAESFAISYRKSAEGYGWKLEATGGIKLARRDADQYLVDCAGTLVLEGDKSTFSMKFVASQCLISDIPLLIPYKVSPEKVEWSTIAFRLNEIAIKKDNDGWQFETDFALQVTKTFPQLMKILPRDGIGVRLKVAKGEATIQLRGELDIPIPSFTIPAVGNLPPFELGVARFSIGNLRLVVGKQLAIECDFSYSLPARTNHFFGTDPVTKKPKFELFEVVNPETGRAPRSLTATFYAGYKKDGGLGIGVRVSDVPAKALQKDPDGRYRFDLGPIVDGAGKYGSVKFRIPEFAVDLNKGGLTVDIDVELVRDFAIPLDLLKKMLQAGGQPRWANQLPDAIPIPYLSRPSLFENGEINIEGFKKFYRDLFKAELPQGMVDALKDLNTVAKKLPDRLKPYLDLPRPKGIKFRVVVRADGSVDLTLSADPCVRLLTLNPPFLLQGITLRSLSFGALFGGQLFSLRIDADLEQFDIFQLFTALVVPETVYPLLGDPTKFGTTFHLNEIFIIIVYQSGIPIPVPLFYKLLGIDYRGIGDFGFTTGISFPEPQFDLVKLGELLAALIAFVTDKNAKLNRDATYPFDISFALKPSYVTAPRIVGGQNYGLINGWKPPSLYKTFATIANAVKFADIREAIQIIDLNDRFHIADEATRIRFACIDISVEWLLTDPDEFWRVSRAKMKLDERQAQAWLDVVPSVNDQTVQKTDKGLLAYFRGSWRTDYGTLEVIFGMVTPDPQRFRMGLSITGSANGVFDIRVRAFSKVDRESPYFYIYGNHRSVLMLGALTIFDGETTLVVSGKEFHLDGMFSILNAGSIVYLGGKYGGDFNNQVFGVSGSFTGQFLVFQVVGSGGIRNTGISGSIGITGLPPTALTIEKWGNGVRLDARGLQVGWTTIGINAAIAIPEGTPVPRIAAGISFSTLGFCDLSASLNASAGERRATGTFLLRLFNADVLNGNAKIEGDAFGIDGTLNFSVIPGTGITANVRGGITPGGFELRGDGSFWVGRLSAGCSVFVGSSIGFGGTVTLLGVDYAFKVIPCNGQVIVVLKAFSITSYIDSGGLHVGKQPPCGANELPPEFIVEGATLGPSRVSAGPALFLEVLAFAQDHFKEASAVAGEEWQTIATNGEGGDRITLEARRRATGLSLRLEAADRASHAFVSELVAEVEKIINAPIRAEDATVTLEIVLDGEATHSELTIHFHAEPEHRRHVTYRYPGLFPTTALYIRVAAKMRTE